MEVIQKPYIITSKKAIIDKMIAIIALAYINKTRYNYRKILYPHRFAVRPRGRTFSRRTVTALKEDLSPV